MQQQMRKYRARRLLGLHQHTSVGRAVQIATRQAVGADKKKEQVCLQVDVGSPTDTIAVIFLLLAFGHRVSLIGAVQEEQPQKSLSTYYNGIYPALVGTVTSQGAHTSEAKLAFICATCATSLAAGGTTVQMCTASVLYAGIYFYIYSVLRQLAQVQFRRLILHSNGMAVHVSAFRTPPPIPILASSYCAQFSLHFGPCCGFKMLCLNFGACSLIALQSHARFTFKASPRSLTAPHTESSSGQYN